MTTKEAILKILDKGPMSLRDIVLNVLELIKAGEYKTNAISVTDVVNRNLKELLRNSVLVVADSEALTYGKK